MTSGYTHCACRDCFEITVSSDDTKPELCHECIEAGCDGGECCRPDAYGMDEEEEENPAPMCPLCSGFGVSLGSLGRREHFRCRACGGDFSHLAA